MVGGRGGGGGVGKRFIGLLSELGLLGLVVGE